jgi:hypothetical protein
MNTATLLKLGAVLFIASALSRHSPALAFAFIVACLVVSLFWRFFVFALRYFSLGLFAALGVRESGILKQFRPRKGEARLATGEKTRGRRARTWFPWQEHGDDLPPEL